jgi:hypothetical protein
MSTTDPATNMAVMPAATPPPLPPVRLRAALAGFLADLAIAVVVMLAAGMLAGAIWGLFTAFQAGLEGLDPGDIDALSRAMAQPGAVAMVWMTLFSGGMAALVLYWWRRPATTAERAGSRAAIARPATWGWVLVTGLAVAAFSHGVSWIGERFGILPEPTNVAMIEAAFSQNPLFMLVFAVLLAPAYEELLFRRVLFGRLWQAGWPGLGLVLSGAAFALVHELPGMSENPWPAVLELWLVYGAMGAAFAWVYRRTGTLWAAIGAHALNNALACALLLTGQG